MPLPPPAAAPPDRPVCKSSNSTLAPLGENLAEYAVAFDVAEGDIALDYLLRFDNLKLQGRLLLQQHARGELRVQVFKLQLLDFKRRLRDLEVEAHRLGVRLK